MEQRLALSEDNTLLSEHPRAYWGRTLAGVAVAGVLVAGAVGYHLAIGRQRECQGAERKLAGVWDSETKRQIEHSFLSTKQSYARTAWQNVERSLDAYTREWVAAQTDTCEATYVRKEQSDVAFAFRTLCLERRLIEAKALTGLFARPDDQVLQSAVKATRALQSLKSCSDLPVLGAKVGAPEDLLLRVKVEEVRRRLAEVKALHALGKHARAAELASAAVQSANELGHKPVQAEALYALAQNEEKQGQFAAAQKALEDVILTAEASSQDELSANAWILLVAVVGYQQAHPEEGHRLARFAAAAVERLGPEHVLEGELHQVQGVVFGVQKQYDQSLAHFEKALSIQQRARGDEDPEVASTLHHLGIIHGQQGEYAQALEDHQRALRIRERSLGADHPDVAVSLNDLGAIYSQLGHLEDSLAAHERALAIRQAAFGDDHPQVAASLNNLAMANARLGREEQARSGYERSIAIYEKAFGPEHQDLVKLLDRLGALLLNAGERDRALSLFRRALTINEKAWGADHPVNAALLVNIGKTLIEQHQPAEAIAPLERAVARKGEPADLASARFALARALWDAGRARDRAKRLAVEAKDTYERGETQKQALEDVDSWLAIHGLRHQNVASARKVR